MTALHHAITLAGSEAELVRRMQQLDPTSKIDRAHLYYWRTRATKGVPADHCRLIERAVGGQVTVHDLRPDVFGPSRSTNESEVAP